MPTTPAASPSSPSTKFTAFTVATTTTAVRSAPWAGVERELAAVRLGEEHELDAGDDQEAGREHLAAELGEGVELEQVVEHADRADHRAGDQDDAGVAEHERALPGQEGQLPPDDVRRGEAAEHGQPAEVGNRLGVDVAVPDLGDGPGAQGDLPGDDREEVGDRGGHQEDERRTPASGVVREGRAEWFEHRVQLVEGQRATTQDAAR